MFKKDVRTGAVLNMSGDYERYRRERDNAKKLLKQKIELNTTRSDIASLKTELNTIKDMLKQLLNKKS